MSEEFVEAWEEYESASSDQLTLHRGDILAVVYTVNEDWLYCVNEAGQIGLAPKSYTRPFSGPAVGVDGAADETSASDDRIDGRTASSTAEQPQAHDPREQRHATGEDSAPPPRPAPAVPRAATASPGPSARAQPVPSRTGSGSSSSAAVSSAGPVHSAHGTPSQSPLPSPRPVTQSSGAPASPRPTTASAPSASPASTSSKADREHLMGVIRELQDKCIAAESERDILQSKLDAIQKKSVTVDDDRARLAAVIRERHALEEKCRYVELQLEAAEEEKRDLFNEISDLRLQLDEERRMRMDERPESRKLVDALRSQSTKLQDEVAAFRSRNQELQLDLQRAQERVAEAEADLTVLHHVKSENVALRKREQELLGSRGAGIATGSATTASGSQAASAGGSGAAAAASWSTDSESTVIRLATEVERERLHAVDLAREVELLSKQLAVERSNVEVLSNELKNFHLSHRGASHSFHGSGSAGGSGSGVNGGASAGREQQVAVREVEDKMLDSRLNTEILAAFHTLGRARCHRDTMRAMLEETRYFLVHLRKEGLTHPTLASERVAERFDESESPIADRVRYMQMLSDAIAANLQTAKDHESEALTMWMTKAHGAGGAGAGAGGSGVLSPGKRRAFPFVSSPNPMMPYASSESASAVGTDGSNSSPVPVQKGMFSDFLRARKTAAMPYSPQRKNAWK